jgi:peptidyl-dipeptidase Dcp
MTAPLTDWTGPMGGVPPLDRVEVAAFRDAVLAAIDDEARELAAIRDSAAAPSFDNTVLAMEAAGESLRRVWAIYGTWGLSFSTPELRELRRELEPRLSARTDAIYQDAGLFQRVKAVRESTDLDDVQGRLVDRLLERFEDAGAGLDEAARERVSAINLRLSSLYTAFSDQLLADEEDIVTWLDGDQLDGLPGGLVDSMKAAAVARDRPAAWALLNTRSAVEPFLTFCPHRALREAVWRRFVNRGALREDNDTRALIPEILALRQERAALLGHETHAHKVLARTMAKTPARAVDLMKRIWGPAREAFRREVAAMQALADGEGAGITIRPWDTRFYGEKVRRRDHALDPAEVQAYFRLEPLREGMFWAATERFGWSFSPAEVPVGHADVRVWEVRDAEGRDLGLFHFDPFARPGKRSGAWMNAYRVQTTDEQGQRVPPIIQNTCNFLRPSDGQPAFLTMDEARTLFHEFGHAMHGLASDVPYRSLAGTAVPRDYVEFPSQLNEHWLTTPELLARFARHAETDEPLPAALLERIEAAANADSGFRTMEFLASAVVDMELHLRREPLEGPADVEAAEKAILDEWGLPAEVVMRHRTPAFAHVFSGEGYAAGYYSYLWADTLVADAAEAFDEQGFYERDLSRRYLELVLSKGHSIEPDAAFRALRGRDPDVGALLRERGLVEA